jgi:tRNA (adenine22-N1)-methyltransferase
MNLSKRLLSVASFVEEGAFIADVGSDHAELPIFLLEEKRIRGAQTIENKKGPYQRMARAIEESGFLSSCELSLSDGISELSEKVDTVVLAGMGGGLILAILEAHPDRLSSVRTLIIDAHTDREKVRSTLPSLGFQIVDEDFLVEEGIAYDVLKAERTAHPKPYSAKEIAYGPINLLKRPQAWLQELEKRKERLLALIKENKASPGQLQKWEGEVRELSSILEEKA